MMGRSRSMRCNMVSKHGSKRPRGRPWTWLEDNTKIVREISVWDWKWIQVALDRVWRTDLNAVLNIWSHRSEEILHSWVTTFQQSGYACITINRPAHYADQIKLQGSVLTVFWCVLLLSSAVSRTDSICF
jgi:hypothetical protein